MKFLTFFAFLALSLQAISQNNISLEFNHLVANEALVLNQEFNLQNGDFASLDRCEYYISKIKITHDGGTITEINDYWMLVDAFDPETYDLGNHDVTEVESITFSVGVETPQNHDDPAAWPNQHPLSPQNPSMHWGWASGYRFVAMEGMTGATGADFGFQVHALGDSNYFEQTIELSATASEGEINLAIAADYTAAYENVSTNSGGTTHGEGGDAVDVLNNFKNSVFSAGVVTSVEQIQEQEISVSITPNPTAEGNSASLILELVQTSNYEIAILDISGKLVHSEKIQGSVNTLALPSLHSGTYLISFNENGVSILTERWIVK